jgi:hypothetical protein
VQPAQQLPCRPLLERGDRAGAVLGTQSAQGVGELFTYDVGKVSIPPDAFIQVLKN